MPHSSELLPLHLLPAGSVARVAELLGDAEQIHRLEELGVRRGVEIEMVSAGSPCIVSLAGSRLCFRPGDLLGVLVAREEAA